MKVISLKAENLKRLTAVEITPDGALVQITGKNGAGKSSVLDAIWYALGGERNIPGEPVRKGQKSAKVELDLGELLVERRWTEKGTYLFVANKDGARYPNPQKVLDTLVGTLTFDPLAFARLERDKQAQTLSRLVGLDLSDLEKEHAAAYDQRRDWNRDVKRLQAEVDGMPDSPEPAVPNGEEAGEALARARAAVASRAEAATEVRVAEGAAHAAAEVEATAQAEIARLTRDLEEAVTRQLNASRATQRAQEALGQAQAVLEAMAPPVDEAPLVEAVETVRRAQSTHETWRRQQAAKAERERQLKAAKAEAEKLSTRLEAIEEEKEKRLAACTMPVEGLALDADGVRFNEIPFEQCSSAEQLRISTAIAMRLNPKLRVLRIADGSLLDSGNLAMLAELAEAQDYQIWIERVDESGEVGIVIEDGRVAGAAGAEEEA